MDLKGDLLLEQMLFSETGGFIIEVDKKNIKHLESIFKKYKINLIPVGWTNDTQLVNINNVIIQELKELKIAWENGLRNKL